jgi:ElaB/YqjD/DUF883 family membrane-anchored ribosome-binding protein
MNPSDESKENPNAEELLKATARNVSELAQMATHQIESTFSTSTERLAEMQEAVAEKARECLHETDTFVREHPWKAVGWAAGAGLILGLLLRRR